MRDKGLGIILKFLLFFSCVFHILFSPSMMAVASVSLGFFAVFFSGPFN